MTLHFEVYDSEALQFVRTARSPHDGEISGEVFREYRHGQRSRELLFASVTEAGQHAAQCRIPLVLNPSGAVSPSRQEPALVSSTAAALQEAVDDPFVYHDTEGARDTRDAGMRETNRLLYAVRRWDRQG